MPVVTKLVSFRAPMCQKVCCFKSVSKDAEFVSLRKLCAEESLTLAGIIVMLIHWGEPH